MTAFTCKDCLFSCEWKDWGPQDVYRDPVHAGWEGVCLIRPNAVNHPSHVGVSAGVCRDFIKHDWNETILNFIMEESKDGSA